MSIRVVVATLGFAVILAPTAAWACDCLRAQPAPLEARKGATVVFEGTLLTVRRTAERTIELDFEVHRSWKGKSSSRVRLYSDGSDCGYGFLSLGTRMLVYAPERAGRLEVGECIPGHRGVFGDEIGRDALILGQPIDSFTKTDAGSDPRLAPKPH